MSKPIDHTGKVFGCLTVIDKAKSRVSPSGSTFAYWNVRCECGNEKQVRAQKIAGNHTSCRGADCNLKWGAPEIVVCSKCNSKYEIKRRERSASHVCIQCRAAHGSSTTRGKPAHNRLPGSEGSFNVLYGSYLRAASFRGIQFYLTKDDFAALTKEDCHYCGSPPSQLKTGRKGKPDPYVYNGVDRLESGLPYQRGNVVACCSLCNYMKSDMSYQDFLERVQRIADRLKIRPPKSGNRGFVP